MASLLCLNELQAVSRHIFPDSSNGLYPPQCGIQFLGDFRRIYMPRWFFCNHFFAVVLPAFFIVLGSSMYPQSATGPQPAPLPAPVPAPVDQPYAGTISLSVDLTNVNDRVLNVREIIPVKPGEITLLYPQWLPGTHSPSNQVANMA